MHQPHVDDPDLIADAVAYVTELRDEVEAEMGPTKVGAGRAVLEMVLADPALCSYVRRWARQRQSCESKVGPVLHLPVDSVYRRLRGTLIEMGGRDDAK